MKELTIEEKAQRYDEALYYAKSALDCLAEDYICNHLTKDDIRGMYAKLFPELAESDDERIRKGLIDTFSIYYKDKPDAEWDGKPVKDILAWLEKQGEKPQGKSALEAVKEEKVDNANKIEPKDYNSIDPHFGKPIDKVEPKFHEGDWAVYNDNGDICQIKSIRDNKYCLWPLDSNIKGYLEIIDVDNEYHLWNITKDAKDGDILSYREGQWIFIYKEKIDDNSFSYYALYSTIHQDLTINDAGFTLLSDAITPATKEQRGTLEKAMTNAGWEFDFEKKELKKIEQNPAKEYSFNIESELFNQLTKEQQELWRKEIEQAYNVGADSQKPSEWSEDDEQYLLVCKNALAKYQASDKWDATIISQWLENKLKSLRLQEQWKPSEEQMNALNDVISSRDIKYDVLSELWKDLKQL